jgi:hypothetical protein
VTLRQIVNLFVVNPGLTAVLMQAGSGDICRGQAFVKIIVLLLGTAALMSAVDRPAIAATVTAKVTAQVTRPLTLASRQDLDFGTIIMPALSAPVTVAVSPAGLLTCPSVLTCSGAVTPAIYNVTGTNNQVVRIYAAPVNLVNPVDGRTIVFTPILPAGGSLTLTNSGNPGSNFNVGGSIVLNATTTGGRYAGDINVTVDYN